MADAAEVAQYIAIPVLVCFSATFSGLTLGLLSLDVNGLDIIAAGAESLRDREYAKRILPVRKRGNWLLCTLLLGNVAVNSFLSILMADFTDGLVGFIVSTGLILLLGEIIPMALCSRYSLLIGGHAVYLVMVLMAIMAPIAYPTAKVCVMFIGFGCDDDSHNG